MIVYALGSWTTPEIDIIQLASFPGDIAVPFTVKLNGPVLNLNELLISSNILSSRAGFFSYVSQFVLPPYSVGIGLSVLTFATWSFHPSAIH